MQQKEQAIGQHITKQNVQRKEYSTCTKDFWDTYTRLSKYAKQIYNEIYGETNEESCYSTVCNINKKKNLTPEIYKIIQLQQIPNVLAIFVFVAAS